MNPTLSQFVARVLIPTVAVLLLGAPVRGHAGSIAGFGGATEITQLMNNTELITQVGQQAQQVAQAVQQTITQINQYATMLQHLKQLAPDQLSTALAPYQTQAGNLQTVLGAVSAIQKSSASLSSMLNGNVQDMAAMNMTPQQYLNWMLSQSKNRQGAYAQKLQQEMQAINDFQGRYQALQQVQANIPGIDGQVKGLQSLNQTMGMATGELMDMRLAIQQQQLRLTQKDATDAATTVNREALGSQNDQANSDALNRFGGMFQGSKAW